MTTLTPEQQEVVARRFQVLVTRWNAATRYRSNINALRSHPVYRELVNLGDPAVPLILAEVEREPNVPGSSCSPRSLGRTRYPALAGRVNAMAEAWLDWGRRRGYGVSTRTGGGIPRTRRRRLYRGQPQDARLQLRCLGR